MDMNPGSPGPWQFPLNSNSGCGNRSSKEYGYSRRGISYRLSSKLISVKYRNIYKKLVRRNRTRKIKGEK